MKALACVRCCTIAALSLVWSFGALGATEKPPDVCKLKTPPPEAVKLNAHGIELRIFPEARAIDATFSGCQNVWLASGLLLAQATYRNGAVTKYVGSDPGGRSVSCLYESRHLVASAGDCPPFEAFPLDQARAR